MNFKQEIKDKEYLHSIEIDDLKDMHSQEIKKLKTSTMNKLEFQTGRNRVSWRWKKICSK